MEYVLVRRFNLVVAEVGNACFYDFALGAFSVLSGINDFSFSKVLDFFICFLFSLNSLYSN